jgi:type IV secretory pathway ATPase VirB11/archaellum biosynthesis ATPase
MFYFREWLLDTRHGTIHADSVDTVIKRLETPPIELSPTLLNVLDCVCIMTHAVVGNQETRKLKEIVEIINVTPEGVAQTNTPIFGTLQITSFTLKKQAKFWKKSLREMAFPFRSKPRIR